MFTGSFELHWRIIHQKNQSTLYWITRVLSDMAIVCNLYKTYEWSTIVEMYSAVNLISISLLEKLASYSETATFWMVHL